METTVRESFTLIRVLVIAVVVSFTTPADAAEPQVAFVVKDGWVEFALSQDDKPVPDAQVRVFTTNGHKFAEGETGPGGRGEFPLPPGHSFRVEIKIGDRTADPILLTPIDDHVVPTNVLLSFGLAPCCKVPSRGSGFGSGGREDPPTSSPTTSSGSIPIWAQVVCNVLFTALGVSIIWMSRRQTSPTNHLPSKDTP
jgi:hypothetical protein